MKNLPIGLTARNPYVQKPFPFEITWVSILISSREQNISSKFGDGHTYVQYAIQPEAGGSSSRNPNEKRQHTVMGGTSLSTVLLSKDWLKRLDEDESCQQTWADLCKSIGTPTPLIHIFATAWSTC